MGHEAALLCLIRYPSLLHVQRATRATTRRTLASPSTALPLDSPPTPPIISVQAPRSSRVPGFAERHHFPRGGQDSPPGTSLWRGAHRLPDRTEHGLLQRTFPTHPLQPQSHPLYTVGAQQLAGVGTLAILGPPSHPCSRFPPFLARLSAVGKRRARRIYSCRLQHAMVPASPRSAATPAPATVHHRDPHPPTTSILPPRRRSTSPSPAQYNHERHRGPQAGVRRCDHRS